MTTFRFCPRRGIHALDDPSCVYRSVPVGACIGAALLVAALTLGAGPVSAQAIRCCSQGTDVSAARWKPVGHTASVPFTTPLQLGPSQWPRSTRAATIGGIVGAVVGAVVGVVMCEESSSGGSFGGTFEFGSVRTGCFVAVTSSFVVAGVITGYLLGARGEKDGGDTP